MSPILTVTKQKLSSLIDSHTSIRTLYQPIKQTIWYKLCWVNYELTVLSMTNNMGASKIPFTHSIISR